MNTKVIALEPMYFTIPVSYVWVPNPLVLGYLSCELASEKEREIPPMTQSKISCDDRVNV